MKTYYAVGVVTYTDDSEEDEEPFNGKEVYTVIVTANTKELGKQKAMREISSAFEDDAYEEGVTKNVKIILDEFYETSEDARR
jgi:hypothetical protein